MSDFIPQMKPWFDEKETEALVRYMGGGGWLTEFQETRTFARMIADYTGAQFCSILSNGSVTLTAALLAMGIGAGDEVIVPAYTMIATANAVLLAQGARPVFADVERESLCLDYESVRAAMTERTRALILVSINGRYPKRLDELLELCRTRRVRVIEDAAQSLGSFHRGRHVGTFGSVGSFSFSMPKIITTGQGGALITDDQELYKKIELVRNFGREEAGVDRHVFIGTNFKFTDLQAVIGIEQMKKVEHRVVLKRALFKSLRARLAAVDGLRFLDTPPEVTPWFNDVLVQDPPALQAHLKGRGIGSRPFYPSVPSQAPYDMPLEAFPNAEYAAAHGLWLPSFSQMTEVELTRLVEGIQSFFS
jgi:perosamine synthetase